MKPNVTIMLGVISLMAAAAVVTPALAGHGAGNGNEAERGNTNVQDIGLDGSQIPAGGDADGRGSARLKLRPQRAEVCFELRWKRLDGVVAAAHIHEGPRGAVGPHHIDLFNDEHLTGRRNVVSACVQVPDGGHQSTATAEERIKAVIEQPEHYYLNVHSSAFPQGAIRGQLGR